MALPISEEDGRRRRISLWILESGTAGLIDLAGERRGFQVARTTQALGHDERLRDRGRLARPPAPERQRAVVAKRLVIEARDFTGCGTPGAQLLQLLQVARVSI